MTARRAPLRVQRKHPQLVDPTLVPDVEATASRRVRWPHVAMAGALLLGLATVRVSADAKDTTVLCNGKRATIVGDAKANSLAGTSGADVIWAGGGDDSILGFDGNDVVCSGPGRDLVAGGNGNDWIDGSTGYDRVYGEGGTDTCLAAEVMLTCESSTSPPPPTAPPTTAPPTTAPPTTAPPTTAPPTTAPPTTAPPTTAPPSGQPPGLYVDEALLPAPAAGDSTMMIGGAAYAPFFSDGVGAMRVPCSLSHMNFDDPIVFPGVSRATHLHAFFGNTGTNAHSTSQSVVSTGNSTCDGGTANRSAYWAPAMIDTATGAPVRGDGDHALQVYYKTGYRGVPSNTVVNFPAGLRMIAGDSRRTTAPDQYDPSSTRYECHGSGTGQHFTNIPSCAPGQILIMAVQFPQCWDGVNLDSPDHKSHMAYGTPYGLPNSGCPASHPVPLPEITMNMRYPVPASGSSTWRLSSDVYNGPAGYSGHADWWNGWHAPTFQRVVTNCYRPGLDCQMGLLGDGQALH